MKIVIPSKNRADIIGDKALRLFPDATLCVADNEVDAYAKVSDRLLVHPAGVVGIGPLRQWVLDHVDDPCVVMVDDDVTHVYSQIGFHKQRIEDADTARAIVERMAILCDGDRIEPRHLPAEIRQAPSLATVSHLPERWEEFKKLKQQVRDAAVDELERRFLMAALQRCDGNVSRAAEEIGMQRPNLHALLRKHGISGENGAGPEGAR